MSSAMRTRAASMDYVDIGDADESQCVPQVRRGEVDGTVDRYAARRDDDIGFLPFEQPLRAVLGVAEREPRSRHLVDPGFKRGRYAEVVNRHADDKYVGGFQLVDECVGFREDGTLLRAALFRRGEVRVDPGLVNERQPLAQVAPGQLDVAVALLERADQVGAQHAAHRAIVAAARRDLQYLERSLSFRVLHQRISSVHARSGSISLHRSLTIDWKKINSILKIRLFS